MISVILCTHNPRPNYLTRALTALRNQTLTNNSWELLIIDNASSVAVAPQFDLSWHPRGRHIYEEELGLTPARLRGIAEATAELMVFVDDDNILSPNYLDQSLQIAKGYPFLGAWSGAVVPEFETPAEDWTKPYHGWLTIRTVDSERWCLAPLSENVAKPCGAGLCVRSHVARDYSLRCRTDDRRRQLDRTGSGLTGCGDHDLAQCACDRGLGTGLFPTLKLTHIMPASRLTLAYLSRVLEGATYSSILLEYFREGRIPVQRSLLRCFADWLRGFTLSTPDRLIRRAMLRGRQRATQEIQQYGLRAQSLP